MKKPFSFRAFLHTRLGAAVWTLLVAILAYQAGQISSATHADTAARAPRITT